MEQQNIYYNKIDELDEEFTIDFKKIFFAIWNRKYLLVKVFVFIFAFMVITTFTSAKKYTVDADLYINKANNTNLVDVNPYAIEELGASGGMAAMLSGGAGALADEIELIQSPLVIDKVIKENDLRNKKVFGIITTKKTGQLMTTENFLKRNISIENKKGTKVVSIKYKSKNRELAYNVVTSIINNYVVLHKQLHSEKAKADKAIIEKEYNLLKQSLDEKVNALSGIPESALNQASGISAMSAFSNSAQTAMSSLKSQLIAGQKSKIAVTEETAKMTHISSKLQWAKLVEEMSGSSKVLVLKAPRQLQEYEQTSPKLFKNILLGIVFGVIGALFALILVEIRDKKLTYSMLSDSIIYNVEKDFSDLKLSLISNQDKKILFAMFDNLPQSTYTQMQEFKNITFIKPEISTDFVNAVKNADEIIVVAKVGETDSKLYKQVKTIFKDINKHISKEVLV